MGREWLRRRAGVLAVRDFRRFYAGYATSLLGSSMSTVAIAWAVLGSGANATGLGYVFAAAVVPQVLLLAIAGAVADRLGRRRVMLTADALRCAAQASLAAAVFAGRPALWVFVLLAWLVGTGEAFFTPAMDALTVEVAPRDQLGNANALYGLATSATRIAGPVLGGLLIALTGPGVVVAADAASYAVSVLALSLIRVPAARTVAGAGNPGAGDSGAGDSGAGDSGAGDPGAGDPGAGDSGAGDSGAGNPGAGNPGAGNPGAVDPGGGDLVMRRTLWRDMAEGWAEFRSRTWLWATTVQFAFFNLITWAPWMLLGPVMGRAYLGGAAVWGAIMGVQGAGAIAAGLLSLGRRPRRPIVVATIGTFCYALPDVPMALHASAVWVAAAAFCCGAGSAVFSTFYSTTLQQQVPPELLARVSALSIFPAYGIGVIGYAIDGPLAAAFGPAAIFGVGAVYGLLSSAAVLTLRSVRRVTWADSQQDGP